jgi:hypothetical protein
MLVPKNLCIGQDFKTTEIHSDSFQMLLKQQFQIKEKLRYNANVNILKVEALIFYLKQLDICDNLLKLV